MPSTHDKPAGQRHDPDNSRTVRSPEPWRAALYGRVSEDRNFGASTDEQDLDNTEAADTAGWPIAGRYSDKVTASRFGTERRKIRADFERLVADIEAGRIEVVIVWEVSRLTRDLEIGARLVKTCRARKVRIHVTIAARTYNLSRPTDVDDLHKAMAAAAHESEMTSVRVRRNKKSAARAGKPHGRVNYGYERIYDAHTKQLVAQRPHEDLYDPATGALSRAGQAPIVREIIRRIGQGVPLSVLAAELTARGVPAPRGQAWIRSTVRRLALNPIYVGQRIYTRPDDDGTMVTETLEGSWPALVTDLEHHAALAVLSDPARTTTRPGAHRWLLSYLAVCRCGAGLSATTRRGKPMYTCSVGQCASILVEDLDAVVRDAVCFRLSEPASFAALTAAAADERVLTARAELAALEDRRDDYVRRAAAGAIDADFAAAVIAELRPQIIAARSRAAAVAVPPSLRAVLGEEPEPFTVIADRFDRLAVAQRKAIVRALLRVELHPARRSRKAAGDTRRIVIEPVPAG